MSENTEDLIDNQEPAASEIDAAIESDNTPQEYAPDFSYKFKDEERTFDERFHGSVKTKEDEDALRDLYTRSAGMDSFKDQLTSEKTRASELHSQLEPLTSGYQTLQDLVQKKDMRGLAQALGLDKETLINYSNELLDEEELPEKEQQLIQQNRQMTQQMADMRSQIDQLSTDVNSGSIDSEIRELETLVQAPSILPIAQIMQERGLSIIDEVVKEGRSILSTTKKEPSIASVVDIVFNRYKFLAPDITNHVSTNEQTINNRPAALPTVKGTGRSSIGPKVRSLDDLYKIAGRM